MQDQPEFFNPYYNYQTVRDLSLFFGRQEIMRACYGSIDKGQCLSIVGSRYIGKSSVLNFLGSSVMQQRLGHDLHHCILILTDWREYRKISRADFFRTVCEEIIVQSQPYLQLEMPSSSEGDEQFKRLLKQIKAAGYRTVLLMDAFDNVTINPHFDPDFFVFLRSLAGLNPLISYVTATRKPLNEVCHSNTVAESPFFNIFHRYSLGPLSLEEARELITRPAQKAGCEFSGSEVEWVLSQAGRHPFFLQIACRYLFDEKLRNHGNANLARVQQQVYTELEPLFDQLWNDLNGDQRGELKLEVPGNGQQQRKFPELSESGLFGRRLLILSQIERPELRVEDVKEALDKLHDTDFLEKSVLSQMHYVALRSGNNPAGRKGNSVREFLRAAFERMRAGGARSDGAYEWRYYNILHYYYFKHQLTNETIAGRLGISNRQFYREKDRAIQMLHKELRTLEDEAINRGIV